MPFNFNVRHPQNFKFSISLHPLSLRSLGTSWLDIFKMHDRSIVPP